MINIKQHRDTKNGFDKIFRTPSPVKRGLWSYLEQGTRAAFLEGIIR